MWKTRSWPTRSYRNKTAAAGLTAKTYGLRLRQGAPGTPGVTCARWLPPAEVRALCAGSSHRDRAEPPRRAVGDTRAPTWRPGQRGSPRAAREERPGCAPENQEGVTSETRSRQRSGGPGSGSPRVRPMVPRVWQYRRHGRVDGTGSCFFHRPVHLTLARVSPRSVYSFSPQRLAVPVSVVPGGAKVCWLPESRSNASERSA